MDSRVLTPISVPAPRASLPGVQQAEGESTERIAAVQSKIRAVERRDWSLWASTIAVLSLLMVGIYSFASPISSLGIDGPYAYYLNRSVQALLGLVCLFVANAVYQQVVIKRLRRDLAEQMEWLVSSEIRADAFRKLSIQDPLTGLSNRRFAEEQLKTEIARAKRLGQPLTALSIDLNNFKSINDSFGHAAGDMVLRQFGELLKKASRGSDTVARTGGDEFLVLLPDCSQEQVEHLVGRINRLEAEVGEAIISVNFAWGAASYVPDMSPEKLLACSDHALYAQKRSQSAGPSA